MFSKEESALVRKEFWTTFGKEYPRKWLLYNTKIKGLAFKFQADRKKASVCIDFEHPEEIANELLYDQFISLKKLLEADLPEVIFDDDFLLDNDKSIHRIYVPYENKFSVHNKNSWEACFNFFYDIMQKFELFFYEYEDFINQAV